MAVQKEPDWVTHWGSWKSDYWADLRAGLKAEQKDASQAAWKDAKTAIAKDAQTDGTQVACWAGWRAQWRGCGRVSSSAGDWDWKTA